MYIHFPSLLIHPIKKDYLINLCLCYFNFSQFHQTKGVWLLKFREFLKSHPFQNSQFPPYASAWNLKSLKGLKWNLKGFYKTHLSSAFQMFYKCFILFSKSALPCLSIKFLLHIFYFFIKITSLSDFIAHIASWICFQHWQLWTVQFQPFSQLLIISPISCLGRTGECFRLLGLLNMFKQIILPKTNILTVAFKSVTKKKKKKL